MYTSLLNSAKEVFLPFHRLFRLAPFESLTPAAQHDSLYLNNYKIEIARIAFTIIDGLHIITKKQNRK